MNNGLRKILKLVGLLILIIIILVWLWLFIKLQWTHKPQSITTVTPNYRIAATGLLKFNYFSPLMFTKGGNVVWYSINPSIGEFPKCEDNEYTQISFFPADTGLQNVLIMGVDVVGGLQCDKKTRMCYYKNIKVMVDNLPCSGDVNTYSSCIVNKPQAFFARYSDVRLSYVIYCCKTENCQNVSEKFVPLERGAVKVRESEV